MQSLENGSYTGQLTDPASVLAFTLPEVLYIDSNREDVELTQLACQHIRAPLKFRLAHSAEQGIAALAAVLAGNGARLPDLILLEVLLEGQKGFEVMEYIRGKPRLWQVPLVVYTAAPCAEVLARVKELGASSLLAKGDYLAAADKLWRWIKGQAMAPRKPVPDLGAHLS